MWTVVGKDAQVELAAVYSARDTTVSSTECLDVDEFALGNESYAAISVHGWIQSTMILSEIKWNFSPATFWENKDIDASRFHKME